MGYVMGRENGNAPVLKYPQQSPPRWVIGTGQLCRLTVPAGPIAHRGGRHDII